MDSITITSTTARRHCFVEEDDGLASIADMEAGFSGHNNNSPVVVSRPFHNYSGVLRRKSSLRNMACVSSPSAFVSSPRSGTSARFYDARFEDHQPHFLESCFLCKKPLGNNRDIFMYRGDTPFCSVECRQEQIEMDEAKEKNYNLSASMKALRKKDQRKSTSPNKTSQDYSLRASTVAAA